MRLVRLYIRNHLLLQNLDLQFERPGRLETGEYALDFLVGLNGSGKSTILRVLTQIIADLRADRPTEFDYILEYSLGQDQESLHVEIQHERQADRIDRRMIVSSKKQDDPLYESEAIDQNYLPERVIVYTTGDEDAWDDLITKLQHGDSNSAPEEIISNPVERSIIELPGHQEKADIKTDEDSPPFLLLRASRIPAITLCGLLNHLATSPDYESQPLRDVLESLGLQHIRGFSLRFRLHERLSSFDTFKRIEPLASRHVQYGSDHLLVFDISQDEYTKAGRFISEYGSSLALFQELEVLLNPSLAGEPTLQKVSLFFEREFKNQEVIDQENGITKLFLFNWLSDGEQSFLGRMALLAILDTDESLIMLDEPEVHFNDYWKREVVNLLDVLMRGKNNHLLITTHSSILLSDVTEPHITTLRRNKEGISEKIGFESPTFGADPSSIMVHIFDSGSAVGAFSTKYLADALERNDRKELEQLLNQVGMGYWYLRIMNRLEKTEDAS